MKNIILIGMPGVGKSTIGVILAKIIGYNFIDTDLIIQEQDGRLLKDIIADQGVEGFIALENQIITGIEADKSVIATGGSVVYGREAMEHLRKIGTIVYLKLGSDALSLRLHNIKNRGVVFKPGQNLEDIFKERSPLYQSYADIIIEEGNHGPEEIISQILKTLEQ